MPPVFQSSFNAGEISPQLYARTELAKYQIGARTLKNFIAGVHGGAFNRPGTRFIAEVKDSSKVHRLIPFQFSTLQSYALEFGDNTMRVFRDGGQVSESDVVISGATKADPVVITATSHGYSDGDWVVISGVVGMVELNGKTFKVANKTAHTFELTDINDNDIDGTGFTDYVSDGVNARIYEIATPYSSTELSELAYAQSADVMYITHPDYFPRKLSRTGHTSWVMSILTSIDGPYSPRVGGDDNIIITPAESLGNDIAITASSNIFVAAMVGAPFRIGYVNPNDAEDVHWGWGTIDQVTDGQNARIDINVNAHFGFQLVENFSFLSGIGFWEDHSTTPGALIYDAGNQAAALLTPGGGSAIMRQSIFDVFPNVVYKVVISVFQVDTEVVLDIGSTVGGSDYLNETINSTGLKTFTFTPTGNEIHISVNDGASVGGDVSKIKALSIVSDNLTSNLWRQPAWTSDNGYPRAVTFFEQRLFFGGTSSEPQTVWSSKTSDFENFGFTTPFQDTDSLLYTMDSRQVNAILWMATKGFIVAGTSRAEWKMFSGINTDAMTPTSIFAKEKTFFGSSSSGILPPNIDNSLLFVQRGSKAVIDLFSSDIDSEQLDGDDISILSSHLIEEFNIVEWGYASLPNSVLWCIRNDGVLLGLTYVKKQEVVGWHRHITNGSFESVAVVSSVSEDETYFIVNRTINGNTVRYVEILEKRITNESIYDYFFVDSGLTYSGGAATVLSGLDHLEGEDVSVLADGEVVEGKTVSSGQITIPNASTLVHIGLPYTSDLESLNIEIGDQIGATHGRKKIVSSANVHFLKTRGAKVGADEDNLNEMMFSDEADGDNPPALFDGKKEVTFTNAYGKEKRVLIRQDAPLPITVLSIIPEVENSER